MVKKVYKTPGEVLYDIFKEVATELVPECCGDSWDELSTKERVLLNLVAARLEMVGKHMEGE